MTKIMYSVIEAKKLMDEGKALMIDVRDGEDYKKEHISGAASIPEMFYHLSDTSDQALMETQEKFQKVFSKIGVNNDTLLILYEDGLATRFGSSCRGWWICSYLGCKNVAILDGGLQAWKLESLPVDDVLPEFTPSIVSIKPDSSLLATKEDVIAAMNSDTVLLDVRDAREWFCEGSSPYDADGKDFSPRRGRIPSAKWMEWYDFLNSSDMPSFKSAEEIVAMMAENGVSPEDDIIIYCFKGSRASNTFAALKMAGFEKLRNYFGSWNEWSKDPSLPVEVANQAA